MQIYGKNVAREKLQTKDKIKKVYPLGMTI